MLRLRGLVLGMAVALAGASRAEIGCRSPVAVPLPGSAGDSLLYGVKTVGPTGFAVGYYWDTADACNQAGTYGACVKPLIEIYSEGEWRFTLPPPPRPARRGDTPDLVNSWLYAVDGTSAEDVWAVGTAASDDSENLCAQDSDCPSASVFSPDVPSNAPRNLRACGNNGRCARFSDLLYRFDGESWTRLDTRPGGTLVADVNGGPFYTLAAFAPNSVDFFGNGYSLLGFPLAQAIHWNGAAFSPIAVTTDVPGLTFTALRLSASEEWLGGDGNMWHGTSGAWTTVPYPTTGFNPSCDAGNCNFFQTNGMRQDPAHQGQLWAVGTYADFSTGAFAPEGCNPANTFANGVSSDCNFDPSGTLSCTAAGACVGCVSDDQCCGFNCGAPTASCVAGACQARTGLNLPYAEHYDGQAWSAVGVPALVDRNEALWSMAMPSYASAAGPAADLWAVGLSAPDSAAINVGKGVFTPPGRGVIEFRGAASGGQWQLATPPGNGGYYGVDALPAGEDSKTRVLAVGFTYPGSTLQAVGRVCSRSLETQ